MNRFLSEFLERARTIWAALGAGPRATLLTFVAALVLLIAVLGIWSAQADYVLLYGGLSPEDAAAVSQRLSDDKVPYKYEASRGAIYVPAGQADNQRLKLAGSGLPRTANEGFEIFDKNSAFGTTEFMQRIQYKRALEGTLARAIKTLDVVESAQVMLTIPDDEVFMRERKDASAAVLLRLRSGRTLDDEQVATITHLVASSVPKLEPRRVNVADTKGNNYTRTTQGDTIGLTNDQLKYQKSVENEYVTKVQSLLDQVLGRNQSAVRVTAQLNFERKEVNSQKADPEGVAIEENVKTEESKGGGGGASGTPGVSANTGGNATVGGSSATTDTTNTRKQKSVNTRYQLNTVTERLIPEVGSLKRLSVAVLVTPKLGPPNAEGKRATLARTPEELKRLRAIVVSAVGGDERRDDIKVDELAFAEAFESVAAGVLPDAVSPWMEYLKEHLSDALAFVGILVLALIFMRMFGKLSAPIEPARTLMTATLDDDDLPGGPNRPGKLQKELKQLVDQNNTQAVKLIQSMLK